ncbi:restriction endonuclease subunit S [Geobacter sp.]|uniref:restriction endonuclease subunit S n=1 Tax=Geobacter sp. TaxID=46610 RepID=UPI002636D25B|nr:restriction endonuclease subunit S [Geobacter sp.]
MSGWKAVAIGDLVSSAKTWNPMRSAMDDVFSYIDLSAVDQDAKTIVGAREIVCGDAPSRARQLVEKGDVLVSTVRPNLNGVARVPEELDGATASTGFCVLRPRNHSIDGAYLFQWVKSPMFISDMVRKATGASYPAVSDRIVAESRIPLPVLPEQRRIAEILDKAEDLRTKRRVALGQLDTLNQSIFLELFGDPVANPKGWAKRAFGEICESRLGKMLDQKQQTGKHLHPYLRNANVQWFHFDLSEVYEMDFDSTARDEFRLRDGDLLICEGGEPGRAAIWRSQLPECYYQKALHRARPREGQANSEYLAWLLWFLSNRGGLGDHVTAATIAHLTGEKLKAMRIPLPPFPLQQEFARRVVAVDKLKTAHLAALAELDALFASLQHRAFRGEL